MTTKDQAIAPDCWVVAKDNKVIGFHIEPFVLSSIESVRYVPAQPPAPDCRTCTDYDRLEGCLRAPRYGVCTNGDQYKPAPNVVLWRTG